MQFEYITRLQEFVFQISRGISIEAYKAKELSPIFLREANLSSLSKVECFSEPVMAMFRII